MPGPKISSPDETLINEVRKPNMMSNAKTVVRTRSRSDKNVLTPLISSKALSKASSKGKLHAMIRAKKMMITSHANLRSDLAEMM